MSLWTEPVCTDVLDRIEPYLDREEGAATRELEGLDRHFAGCPSCAEELALARRIRDGLRALQERPCPERVVERVREALPVATSARWRRPRWRDSRALLAAAAVLLALLSAVAIQRLTRVPEASLASDSRKATSDATEDLVQAEEEVRLALAYLSAVSRRAGLTLRDEVLLPRVLEPPRRALGRLAADLQER